MTIFEKKMKMFGLASPEELFPIAEKEESVLKECVWCTYSIAAMSAEECYREYGKVLANAGFLLRCSTDHMSYWKKRALHLVMEFGDNFIRVSFVATPLQEKIYRETDLRQIFRRDAAENFIWIRLNRKSAMYCLLNYHSVDFSNIRFRQVLVRFADFIQCDFKNTNWHGVKLGIPLDGGRLFCTFKNCDFSGSYFKGVDFTHCILEECNFTDCVFYNCNFRYAVFRNCQYNDFEMQGRCRTEGMIFLK